MTRKKWFVKCSYYGTMILTSAFVLFLLAIDAYALEQPQAPKRTAARKQPSLASQVKTAKEDVARADERARRAEEAASAAQTEASRAKDEAAALSRTVNTLNSRIGDLEEKLNRALTTLDSQQQRTGATDQKVAEVSTQLQADIKKAQSSVDDIKKETKGTITSANAKMSVYGFVVANTSYASSQLNISDIPLWAVPRESLLFPAPVGGFALGTIRAGNVNETILTMRQSRFGMRASMPKVGDWTPSAQVEIDFFGARPSATQGTVFNQPRIRLGFVTLEHTSGLKLVAGQDWVIFAPLNPTSFAHFAIPEAATAGNPWMRLPQIRLEKSIKFDDQTSLLVQGGIMRAVSGLDSPTPGSLADLPTLSGERGVHPFYQSRIALTTPGAGKKPLTIGISGHYGREKPIPNHIETWGVAGDYVLPLHAKAGLSGELWTGSNLAPFQAGILQGAAPRLDAFGRLVDARFRKINATGGWIQLALTPATKWAFNLGYGQDAPRTRDLVPGVNRNKNQLWWSNLMYKIHPNVTMALEYNFFDTIFKVPVTNPARVGTGNYVNLAFVYAF